MTLDKSTARIQEMFGQIAGRYDFLNRLLSLGIDRSWRRKTVKLVPPVGDAPILDVCTGTADLALAYWRASKGNTAIVGTDFCQPMLTIAQEKCRRAGALPQIPRSHAPRGNAQTDAPRPSGEPLVGGDSRRRLPAANDDNRRQESPPTREGTQSVELGVPTQSVGTREEFQAGITLLQADTLRLPFPDNTFQIVSVAFGLRNLSDTDAGLREMVRVCQSGGRVAILEFSTPAAWPLGAMYGWYFRHVLPRIGQALARNRQAAYNYLPQSVGRFPQGEALAERMRAAGLGEVRWQAFTFGVATLYVGSKGSGIRGQGSGIRNEGPQGLASAP